MGSSYVPLDSWIYPLFERLIAMGVINTAIQGMRPWTRLECARLVAEAGENLQDADPSGQPSRTLEMPGQEFAAETALLGGGSNRAVRLESVYTRFTEISGPPLTDGYHFGQTLINDFGRPFQEGFNNVSGFPGWGTAGRWVVYVRGEDQHAPGGSANSPAVQTAIAAIDENPVFPSSPVPARNQARLLDAYVGLNVWNWQLSYGQESQWWSPGESGPFLFSDNSAPVRLFQKISFKPTRNLELGFTRTVIVGGQGRPLTLDRLFRSYFSVTSVNNETPANDPGKRTGGFDFRYCVPLLRKWLTIYTVSVADDDPSPVAAPRRRQAWFLHLHLAIPDVEQARFKSRGPTHRHCFNEWARPLFLLGRLLSRPLHQPREPDGELDRPGWIGNPSLEPVLAEPEKHDSLGLPSRQN
jgi:Capsule assembly protein Wzi